MRWLKTNFIFILIGMLVAAGIGIIITGIYTSI